jgi:hypothetical protein
VLMDYAGETHCIRVNISTGYNSSGLRGVFGEKGVAFAHTVMA